MAKETPEDPHETLRRAFKSDCPKLYCNAFVNALGINDVTLVIQHNTNIEATLNLSLITAKSLAIKLTELVQKFEHSTQSTVPTSDQVAKALGVELK